MDARRVGPDSPHLVGRAEGGAGGLRRTVRLLGGLALATVTLATFALASPVAAKQKYAFVTKWGGTGTGPGQFDWPYLGGVGGAGIATDSAGNVYATDQNNNRVQKFSADGTFITQWPVGDPTREPVGITVDVAGDVYVTVPGGGIGVNNSIQKFTADGFLITQWGDGGPGVGTFGFPDGIAADAAGFVYVADAGKDLVQKFTSSGAYVTSWGGDGPGAEENIAQIATDAAGDVYVTALGHHRIQKFDPGGAFLTEWEIFGRDPEFSVAWGVATDAAGDVYVVDRNKRSVQKFTADGRFITGWKSWRTRGHKRRFGEPQTIAVDAIGNVYIADGAQRKILKFAPVPRRPRIKSGPTRTTGKQRATFAFGLAPAVPGAGYECRLTGERVPKRLQKWSACESPKRYTGLKPGEKCFSVRAKVNGVPGKADRRCWRVEG